MCLENISRGVFRESMCGNPKKFDFRLENENLLYISVILNITYFMKKIKLLGKNMTCFSNLKRCYLAYNTAQEFQSPSNQGIFKKFCMYASFSKRS